MLVHIQTHNHFLACRRLWSTAILRFGVRLESSLPPFRHGSEPLTPEVLENGRLFGIEVYWWIVSDTCAQILTTAYSCQ